MTYPPSWIQGSTPPPLGTGDPVGTTYVDTSTNPDTLYVSDGTDFEVAGFVSPYSTDSNPRLRHLAFLMAVRWTKLRDASLGVAGGFDIGALYVGRIDADLQRMLRGLRTDTVPAGQQWPTLDDLKRHLKVTDTSHDTDLQLVLDAAIDVVVSWVNDSFGVA